MRPGSEIQRGRDAALALRQERDLGSGWLDIWTLLDDLGLPFARHAFGENQADGLYVDEGERQLVVVNSSKWASRQRFTAAHELGHHMMHREDRPTAIVDEDIYAEGHDPREKEANAFAAHLLAPDQAVRKVADRIDERPSIGLDTALELAGSSGLSFKAATWRLVNSDLITKARREELASTSGIASKLARKGYSDESVLSDPGTLPRHYVEDALRLYEGHVISGDRLGELLQTSPGQAQQFAASKGVFPARHVPEDEEAVDALLEDL